MAKNKKRTPRPKPIIETGTVIRHTGARCQVKTEKGQIHYCSVRGKFRIKGIKSTSPVTVGDKVKFILPKNVDELGSVKEILPRKNHILRRAVAHNHMVHILCANIDQAILLFTIDYPVTSTGFADRFLVIAEAYHIPTTIIINKMDLMETDEHSARLDLITKTYQDIGYPILKVSATDKAYQPQLVELLQDKVSFIGGHSGSGKSTLINLIDNNLNIKTGEISTYNNKGMHTTSHSEMHSLAFGGYIVDSPGIKELGITEFDKYDLAHYFPEMKALMSECKFNDCTHTQEPQCAVKDAFAADILAESRYMSYLRMLEEC